MAFVLVAHAIEKLFLTLFYSYLLFLWNINTSTFHITVALFTPFSNLFQYFIRPVIQPQILPESKPKDPRLQKQPASKQGTRKDPRLRKQEPPMVRVKDVENSAELMNDIIKNKSTLSVLAKPSERMSLESLDDVDEVSELIGKPSLFSF